MITPAIFFDRDGVINPLIYRGSNRGDTPPWTVEEFQFYPEARGAVQRAKDAGYMTFIVSNQPDVYSREMHWEEPAKINKLIYDNLAVDNIKMCHQRGHRNYKPNPGMLIDLRDEYNIYMGRSWMIGDTWKDAVAAKLANIRYVHIGKEDPIAHVWLKVANVREAVDVILDTVDYWSRMREGVYS